VWGKRFRQLQFDSQQVFRLIGVLQAAVVAAYFKAAIQRGSRLESVSFAERDLVFEKEILVFVELVVLAKYNPEILAFVAHSVLPGSPRAYGGLALILSNMHGGGCKQIVKKSVVLSTEGFA
jgi:hypothetical protein